MLDELSDCNTSHFYDQCGVTNFRIHRLKCSLKQNVRLNDATSSRSGARVNVLYCRAVDLNEALPGFADVEVLLFSFHS